MNTLTEKQRKYVENRAQGMNKKAAALAAGYSAATATIPGQAIEKEDVKRAFELAMRRHCPAERVAKRIAQGLNAKATKFFAKDGYVTEAREVIDWSERRQYAALAAELAGYHVPVKPQDTKVNL